MSDLIEWLFGAHAAWYYGLGCIALLVLLVSGWMWNKARSRAQVRAADRQYRGELEATQWVCHTCDTPNDLAVTTCRRCGKVRP